MSKIPKFLVYGEDDPTFAERIQSTLPLQPWSNLTTEQKNNMFQSLLTSLWFEQNRRSVTSTLKQLNHRFRRNLPAKGISQFNISAPLESDSYFSIAIEDFKTIFIYADSEDLVLYMISLFAGGLINKHQLEEAQASEDCDERNNLITNAYKRFDVFATHLNHLFEQFSVNVVISRNGIVPRQEDRITKEIYIPTLEVLSDPKWNSVNSILFEMFSDYQEQKYSEVITKAHSAMHQFLKVALENEGQSGKGEFGKLFNKAKANNVISNNVEINHVVNSIKSTLSSERAKKSTAKPTVQKANSADAQLVMNYCFVMIQHCLHNFSNTPDH